MKIITRVLFLLMSFMFIQGVLGASAFALKLDIEAHMADEDGFLVNSYLIKGQSEAILVDAQFTNKGSDAVIAMIRESARVLKTIYITHAHPDHYFGLEQIRAAYPDAEVLADPRVVEEMRKTAPEKLKYWKGIKGDKITDTLFYPQPSDKKELRVDDELVYLRAFTNGESETAVALVIPSASALLAGDLLYNNVHLWLAEHRAEGWLKHLTELRGIEGVSTYYPGHGVSGGPALVAANQNYIQAFLEVIKHSADKAAAKKAMLGMYSNYAHPEILDMSLDAYMTK